MSDWPRVAPNPNGGEGWTVLGAADGCTHEGSHLDTALVIPLDEGGSLSWYLGDGGEVAMIMESRDGSLELVTDMECFAGPAYEDTVAEIAAGDLEPLYMSRYTEEDVLALRGGRVPGSAGIGAEQVLSSARSADLPAPDGSVPHKGRRLS